LREFENFVGSRFTPACNTSHLRGQASRERQRIRKHRSESVAQKRHVYALNRAYALQLARTHTHVPRLRARSSVTNARRSPFPLSHLGDRRVTAHGAFTYTHAPHRRVFAHTRGAVRVRTYLRVRTRRCVLAGNRQTSWLEWGRGGGGKRVNTASTTRRHARSARRSLQQNASCRARQLVCCDVSWPPFSTQPIDCKAVGGHRSTLMLLILVEHCLNFNHPRPLATMKH
jgi:hypothetical protein